MANVQSLEAHFSSTIGDRVHPHYNAPCARRTGKQTILLQPDSTSAPDERWMTHREMQRGAGVANPFWNRWERRLRAFWRLLIYLLVWRAVLILLNHLLIPANPGLAAPALVRTLHYAYYLFSVAGVTWLAARFVDRRTPATLGLTLSRRWWVELLTGLLLGLLLIVIIFAAEWALGWVTVHDIWFADGEQRFLPAILGPLAIFVIIGFCEELIFRGYLLRNCAEGLSGATGARAAILVAWLVSSLLFGLYHFFNPFATWASTLNLSVAGLMFGLPMVLTGRLAMPIGLHITWNFAQANLFGFAVSGNNFSGVTLLRTSLNGPALWTGGAFGPEAGLLGLVAMALGIVTVWLWLRWMDGHVHICTALARYPAAKHGAAAPHATVHPNR
jgi:membrane protease YdiL (CAAX protease family)